MEQIAKGCDILIASPGRLIDFVGRPHHIAKCCIRYMVIDHADDH